MAIALEAEMNPVSLESYSEKYERLKLKMDLNELEQYRKCRSISTEGFFDYFKKKESSAKSKEDASGYELMELMLSEFKEISNKIKTDKTEEIEITSKWFSNAKNANEAINVVKQYVEISKSIFNYYELDQKMLTDIYQLAIKVNNVEAEIFKSKVIELLNKYKKLSTIDKLFPGFKLNPQYKENKNYFQFVGKADSASLYAVKKEVNKNIFTLADIYDETDTHGITYLRNLGYLKLYLLVTESRKITFSQKQYLELIKLLEETLEVTMKMDKDYIVINSGDKIKEVLSKFENIEYKGNVHLEIFCDNIAYNIHDNQDLGKGFEHELIDVCNSVLKILE